MRLFDHILEELGWPAIYLVSPEQFKELEGWNPLDVWGGQGDKHPIITVVGKPDRKMRRNIIYHEILHHLFPRKPHWWIEVVAQKLAKGGGRGEFSIISGHTVYDVPSRDELIKLAKRASKRFNNGG
jgi:hypothetical protein